MSSDLTVNKLFNRKNNVLELSESIELSEKLHEIKSLRN